MIVAAVAGHRLAEVEPAFGGVSVAQHAAPDADKFVPVEESKRREIGGVHVVIVPVAQQLLVGTVRLERDEKNVLSFGRLSPPVQNPRNRRAVVGHLGLCGVGGRIAELARRAGEEFKPLQIQEVGRAPRLENERIVGGLSRREKPRNVARRVAGLHAPRGDPPERALGFVAVPAPIRGVARFETVTRENAKHVRRVVHPAVAEGADFAAWLRILAEVEVAGHFDVFAVAEHGERGGGVGLVPGPDPALEAPLARKDGSAPVGARIALENLRDEAFLHERAALDAGQTAPPVFARPGRRRVVAGRDRFRAAAEGEFPRLRLARSERRAKAQCPLFPVPFGRRVAAEGNEQVLQRKDVAFAAPLAFKPLPRADARIVDPVDVGRRLDEHLLLRIADDEADLFVDRRLAAVGDAQPHVGGRDALDGRTRLQIDLHAADAPALSVNRDSLRIHAEPGRPEIERFVSVAVDKPHAHRGLAHVFPAVPILLVAHFAVDDFALAVEDDQPLGQRPLQIPSGRLGPLKALCGFRLVDGHGVPEPNHLTIITNALMAVIHPESVIWSGRPVSAFLRLSS